ncbi:endothelin receptor type B [Phyllostomus discolor]|uniref:Endothelin receptor type B n=1 Tax=Phyllostomus discolor TaxID=89673 RepID=A0A833Z4D0_9CHIR|nr:endothelin receptor type B [Phyllostomus discolor]
MNKCACLGTAKTPSKLCRLHDLAFPSVSSEPDPPAAEGRGRVLCSRSRRNPAANRARPGKEVFAGRSAPGASHQESDGTEKSPRLPEPARAPLRASGNWSAGSGGVAAVAHQEESGH